MSPNSGIVSSSQSIPVVVSEFDSPDPIRAKARGEAREKQIQNSMEWAKGVREGNFPLPTGTVVTIHLAKVDRGHTDPIRLPGLIVKRSIHEDEHFYRIAVVGGVLENAYKRRDLNIELNVPATAYGLQDMVEKYEGNTLKKISLRTALSNLRIGGGQGHFRCSCHGTCQKTNCKCFKAGYKCNSYCHKKSQACLNKCIVVDVNAAVNENVENDYEQDLEVLQAVTENVESVNNEEQELEAPAPMEQHIAGDNAKRIPRKRKQKDSMDELEVSGRSKRSHK